MSLKLRVVNTDLLEGRVRMTLFKLCEETYELINEQSKIKISMIRLKIENRAKSLS